MTKVELINKIRNNRSFDLRASEFYEPFDISDETIKDMADDFYYLLKDVLNYLVGKEEPVSEDLEKAAKENAKIERPDDTEVGYDINRFGGFVDGANWQKQQMMKDTVSGHVGQTINGMLRALSDETFGDMGFTAGDKVKLIILKED